MKHLTLPILILFLSSLKIQAQATPEQMVDRMGRGINVGNVLSAPFEGNWAPALVESYIQDIAVVGFKNVRVPIRFDNQTTSLDAVNYEDNQGNYIGSPSDYQVNTSYLERIEEVTSWIVDNEMVAIIDVHGDHWFWESYDSESPEYKTGNDRLAAEDRFRAIWRDISVRFQNKSENLLFEIMNEAYFSMSASEVNYINSEILSIIRLTNPSRNVIVNGGGVNSWEAPLQLPSDFLNSDNYLIATFHYYKPFSFTSSSKPQYSDFDWGTQQDKSTVDNHFDQVLNWAQSNNIPVFLGEFGADNECGFNYENGICGPDGGPDNASRVLYHQYLAEAAISRGFSFAAWDAGHKSNKTIYNVSDRSWVTDVRNALLGVDCITSGIIENADIECGHGYNWSVFTQNGAVVQTSNATSSESRNVTSMQVDVSVPGANYNGVVIRNVLVEGVDVPSEQTLNFTCYAKAASTGQKFRLRIKSTVNGNVEFGLSPELDLSSSVYQQYSFQYAVPQNTTDIQFQFLCGKQVGTYFFDDFQVSEETLSLIQNDDLITLLYPNPVKDTLCIKSKTSIEYFELYTINGKKLKTIKPNNNSTLNLSHLNSGLYILKMIYANGINQYKRIIKN
jgi:endoglucanase